MVLSEVINVFKRTAAVLKFLDYYSDKEVNEYLNRIVYGMRHRQCTNQWIVHGYHEIHTTINDAYCLLEPQDNFADWIHGTLEHNNIKRSIQNVWCVMLMKDVGLFHDNVLHFDSH